LNVFGGDAPEAVSHFQSTLYIGNLNVAVVIRHRGVRHRASKINVSEGVA
jgi:hypothetical protein